MYQILTFNLPDLNGINQGTQSPVIGNGKSLGWKVADDDYAGTFSQNNSLNSSGAYIVLRREAYNIDVGTELSNGGLTNYRHVIGITTDDTKSGIIVKLSQIFSKYIIKFSLN